MDILLLLWRSRYRQCVRIPTYLGRYDAPDLSRQTRITFIANIIKALHMAARGVIALITRQIGRDVLHFLLLHIVHKRGRFYLVDAFG